MLKWQQCWEDSWTFRNTNNFTCRKSKHRLKIGGASFHPENDITYLTGNEDKKIRVDFSLLQRLPALYEYLLSAILKTAIHIICVSIACAFLRIRAHIALRVLHFLVHSLLHALFACMHAALLISMLFGTSIPTSFNILVKMRLHLFHWFLLCIATCKNLLTFV